MDVLRRKFDEKSNYDGSAVSTSLLLEIKHFSDHRKRKPKILVVQFYQKTDMPACHHRAYLFLNELKLVWCEYEVWRARGYVANHPNMPKIYVFGHFWLFCGLHNFVTL
jgi:hypothetical protein